MAAAAAAACCPRALSLSAFVTSCVTRPRGGTRPPTKKDPDDGDADLNVPLRSREPAAAAGMKRTWTGTTSPSFSAFVFSQQQFLLRDESRRDYR